MCVCVVCVGKKPPRHISGRYPTMEQEHLYSISSYTHQLGKHPGVRRLMSRVIREKRSVELTSLWEFAIVKLSIIMDGNGPNGGWMDYTLFHCHDIRIIIQNLERRSIKHVCHIDLQSTCETPPMCPQRKCTIIC